MSREIILIFTAIFLYAGLTSSRADITTGLVGWWKFDEASGNAVDSSGNGYDGTPTGTTIVTSGCHANNCRSFDGVGDFVDTGSATIVDAAPDITIAAWVYPTGAGMYPAIATKTAAYDEASSKYAFYLDTATRQPKFAMGGVLSANAPAIALNTWTHIVISSSSDGFAIYENGVSVLTGSPLATPTSSVTTWKIGTWTGGGSGHFMGTMDDVRIYNRFLSDTDVTELYNYQGSPAIKRVSINGRARLVGFHLK